MATRVFDGIKHPVTLKAPLEHVVLRWAKNASNSHFSFSHNCLSPVKGKSDKKEHIH